MEEKKEAVKNEAEAKESRFSRRLKARKQEYLDTLINLFFTERSQYDDPEGEEVDALFVKYRDMWLEECKNFNKNKRRPFTLRGNAFAMSVDYFLKKEKEQKAKVTEASKEKKFNFWYSRNGGWKNSFWIQLWYFIKSFGNNDKITSLWRQRYSNSIVEK